MHRNIILGAVAVLAMGAVGTVWIFRVTSRESVSDLVAKQNPGDPPAANLPLSQVVLFSSGVGYFQREGEVEGNARVDLQFPIGDVNDLLKSMVLQDLGKGKIGIVSYDGQDPIEKTLRSFAVDLTGNPTFGQVLNQARGEKVEVIMQQTAVNQPGTISGVIMGMESQMEPAGGGAREVHLLNLVCAEGMRCVKLNEVQRIRFLNARLDSELKRALDVLASSHDSLKKLVSLNFKGDGKRKVRVGYVAENPIWKTSYRMSLDDKTTLQGWAAVENVTDEDWNDVRVVLVSGRPISFQMDLYPPLYVPRPTVESERFASLRPPTYNGALTNDRMAAVGAMNQGFGGQGNNLGFGGGIGGGGLMGFGGGGFGANVQAGMGQLGNVGNLGGQWGLQGQFGMQGGNRYQNNTINPNFALGAGNNAQVAGQNAPAQNPNGDNNTNFFNNRLTFEQLQERRNQQNAEKGKAMDEAKKVGSKLAEQKLDPHQSIASVAASEEIGDAFRYIIEDRVSLPRQKSALLPLIDKPIQATRVSIFNEAVHAKFPLLGLRFKNTTGEPLTQGPITVFEDGSYAGDARLPDMQADEERLISYAVDLGTEVKSEDRFTPGKKMIVRVNGNGLGVQFTVTHTRKYIVRNRSKQDRTLVIEHPFRSDWKLAEGQKARETTRDVYRFDVPTPAGKTTEFEVAEERVRVDAFPQQWAKNPTAETVESHFVTNMNLEVDQIVKTHLEELLGVKIVKGEVAATSKHKTTRTYRIFNRSKEDRDVTVEHLVPAEWKLLGEAKPVEGSEYLYRFPRAVAAGKAATQDVTEERTLTVPEKVAALSDEKIQSYLAHAAVSEPVKAALRKLAEQKASLSETQRQLTEINAQLKEISDDQDRLRKNLEKVPSMSEAHKRYVKKFDDQETQIEKLQEQLKQKLALQKKQVKELEDNVKGLTVE
jgi:hypothetical protein